MAKRLALVLAPGLLTYALLFAGPIAAQPHAVFSHPVKVARGWRVAVASDRFSGEVRCRLHADDRGIFLAGEALAFRVGLKADVLNASIRIDDGRPIRWRDLLPELARQRIAIDGRDLAAPTDGLVWLPIAMLRGAGRVAIEPGFNKRPKLFRLDGFAAAQARALAMGCPARSGP